MHTLIDLSQLCSMSVPTECITTDVVPAVVAAASCASCCTCTTRRAHLQDTSARHLIPALCELFYDLKWVTGTGGSISIREGYVYAFNLCQTFTPDNLDS